MRQKVARRVKMLNAAVVQTLRTQKEQLDQLVEKQKQIKKLETSPVLETRKEAKRSEAEQQEKEAAEAGDSEADLMEDGRGERSREQGEESVKRIVRDRTLKERLGKATLPAAGETSAAVAAGAHRLSHLAGYTIPRAVSPIAKSYIEILPTTLDGCIIRAPETMQEQVLFRILVNAGLLLSGPRAENYPRLHFRLQKERSTQEARWKGYRREDHRTFNSD
jgi:hypothetical protein